MKTSRWIVPSLVALVGVAQAQPAAAPARAPAVATPAAAAPAAGAAAITPPPRRPTFDPSDPVKYGTALAQYSEDFDAGWQDSYARTTVTQTEGGKVAFARKTRQIVLEGKDGDKSMLRFLSPADISGVAVLNYAHPKGTDDSWLYLPASRRVRRVSGASRTASFQGTEFSYEDLSRIFTSQFDWRFLEEKTLEIDGAKLPVYVLEAKPRYKATGYSKLLLHINRDLWRVERTIFHDRGGRLLKTLTYSRWKHFHQRWWRAGWIQMDNHQTRASTSIRLDPLLLTLSQYDKPGGGKPAPLTDEQFTKRALETF
ncbi:MAG: outer membrane lipoprotein-sorting protein [Myxococcales bacterium]|nr:outer membrane lipoprotein-sorting protein [Myxococcales bacterium]